jgi:hypothetical protein
MKIAGVHNKGIIDHPSLTNEEGMNIIELLGSQFVTDHRYLAHTYLGQL